MHRDVCDGESQIPQPISATSPITGSSIGINLRVTGHCSQGGRKYMEDFFSVAYHESENSKDLEYAFVGIYDGHGGNEAATYAKEHLMMEIINQKMFWSDCDQDVLSAIREGYIATHYAMWKEQEKWPKTATGLPSTAGTTATVAFIRQKKIYIGHVGDSGIVLGYQNPDECFWRAKQLTQDHKPETAVERTRIVNSGGKVAVKSGVPRVVWNRPRTGHKGPVRRSTPIDEIPFLAVARSLGDLWSYNSALDKFVVSPDPDVIVVKINLQTFRCLIFGTDGLWNVLEPCEAVETVRENEIINEGISKMHSENDTWCNPSKGLVESALKKWNLKKMRADNTSVVTVVFCPTEAGSSDGQTNYVFSQMCPQKFDHQQRLLNKVKLDQTEKLPHYETMTPSFAMRMHLQHQLPSQNGYMRSYLLHEDSAYANNYEINLNKSEYLHYDYQTSNNYFNSFAESYNSLLTSSFVKNDSPLSNESSSSLSGNSDESNQSLKCNPSTYHSYNSLHHTGLAGHDRVQHHYPNDEYQIEQKLYQEQCMSAEEGYSLTKLETRGEQKLRGNANEKNSLTGVYTFQIFGGERSEAEEISFHKYNNYLSNFKKKYDGSESSNSNFLSSYEDNARCYEPNIIVTTCEDLRNSSTEDVKRTTSLCIERLDTIETDKISADSIKPLVSKNSSIIDNLEMSTGDEMDNQSPNGKTEINELSSTVIETPLLFEDLPATRIESIPKSLKEHPTTTLNETIVDSTPLKKPKIEKVAPYPNVPNENHSKPCCPLKQQYTRNFEKRMLRSATVDYSKHTLRSRNSFSKDMKSKSSVSSSHRRSNIMQTKIIKARQSSSNVENSYIISRSLTLRSREITTTTGIFPESYVLNLPSSSSNQKQNLKTKFISFCESSESLTPGIGNNCDTGTLHRTVVSESTPFPSRSHHLQHQVSFSKRSNLRNTVWEGIKTKITTRKRAKKRVSR